MSGVISLTVIFSSLVLLVGCDDCRVRTEVVERIYQIYYSHFLDITTNEKKQGCGVIWPNSQEREQSVDWYGKKKENVSSDSTNAQDYYDVTGTLEPSQEIEKGQNHGIGSSTGKYKSNTILWNNKMQPADWSVLGKTRGKQKDLELDPVDGSCLGNLTGLEGRAHAGDLCFKMYGGC